LNIEGPWKYAKLQGGKANERGESRESDLRGAEGDACIDAIPGKGKVKGGV